MADRLSFDQLILSFTEKRPIIQHRAQIPYDSQKDYAYY
jgi:hypothetical protein